MGESSIVTIVAVFKLFCITWDPGELTFQALSCHRGLWTAVGIVCKGSALEATNYWANSLMGMRKEGELKIMRAAQFSSVKSGATQGEGKAKDV